MLKEFEFIQVEDYSIIVDYKAIKKEGDLIVNKQHSGTIYLTKVKKGQDWNGFTKSNTGEPCYPKVIATIGTFYDTGIKNIYRAGGY